ncbi:D-2-hydroxyacid dehydrogenase [Candidatus Stoquefichus massiliensis]|uniref:D-2-hydroxyacid dehydrogenase n=1 Tax=Candidatus Stoquefichus massiliensis TaxID=1470350 RepID=UPI000485480F|nr:D-2-hydroxyacid dehydrogenase [Candidatus Stoquefichus massiliensis]
MRILMLAPLQKENFEKIETHFPDDEFNYSSGLTVTQDLIDECDVIVGNTGNYVNINKENIQLLMLHSAGSDSYIKPGRMHPHTKLTNASGTYGKAIAEHVIGMILTLNKNLKVYTHHMEQHLWQSVSIGKEIYQSTVLIVGLGDIGYELAKRLKAFDCKIVGVKRTNSSLPPYIDELYTTDHIDAILPQADFVILALPQTEETVHMFDKKRLLLMKKDAVLINVGRGSAIVTNDLVDVLKSGHLYGVGLDVVEDEPLSIEHKLWDFENVLITPHASGGYVWASARNYFTDLVIRNLKHFQNHEPLENEVDFQTGYRKIIEYK